MEGMTSSPLRAKPAGPTIRYVSTGYGVALARKKNFEPANRLADSTTLLSSMRRERGVTAAFLAVRGRESIGLVKAPAVVARTAKVANTRPVQKKCGLCHWIVGRQRLRSCCRELSVNASRDHWNNATSQSIRKDNEQEEGRPERNISDGNKLRGSGKRGRLFTSGM
eukprot:1669845-Rhodomonas_salina.2